MTARTVDKCLDEIQRLIAQRGALQGHLWASEYLLHQVVKLLPHMIADSAVSGAYRDALLADITALLEEPREHPGAVVGGDARDLGKDTVSPPTTTEAEEDDDA